MNVSIGKRWEEYVEAIVAEGRYASASEVMREGLRLVEEREQKLASLRATLQAAIAEGGSYSDDDVMAYVREDLNDWEAQQADRKRA